LSYPARCLALGFVVGSLLLCAAGNAALAASGDQPEAAHFSSDTAGLLLRAAQAAPPPGADVLFLDDEETLVFDDEGRAIRSRYALYKILTQKGAEEWSSISLSWEPWRGERPTLRARVITSDKEAHPVDQKTVTDSPAKETQDNVFSDRRVVRAPLPAVAPGALVEEEQTSKENASFIGAAYVERFYFAGSIRIEHTRVVLDAPATLPIHYEIRLLPDLKPERTESGGRVRIVFDQGPIDPVENVEAWLPSDQGAYASVTFSAGSSWQAVAEEYGKVVDQQIADTDTKSLVAKLVAGQNSRDEKAAAILQYLDREVRYTGVEFGDATVVPRSPKETLTRKYGDCKDKAALLVEMLRTANIPAYVALLNAGDREDVSPDLPGMGMFDHAIVYAPGPPELWIDATDEYARVGELPIADQERFALVARPGSTSLLRTPATSSVNNLLVEKRDIHLAENGPARIIETSQPHGSSESSYRRSYADKENKAAKDELTSYVKSEYLAEKLDRIDRSDPNDLYRGFELILETDHARRGVTDLNVAAAAIRLESLFSRLPADLRQREKKDDGKTDKASGSALKKPRASDYQLPEAFVTEWHYAIVPPLGFRPKPLPQNAKLALGPAILTEEFAADKDGVVSAIIRFDTVKRRLTVPEATELRSKVAQLLDGAPILIYFEPVGQVLMSQGKVKEALQSYRDLVALHPKEAVHHLQLAETFLSAGLGEAARSEAHDAFKLEPSSALAAKTLAEILEHDIVGRKFRPGSDYAGAEAAFRAAETLDPEDKATVANLAILLEYNHWGVRYGPGAKLKDAVTEYRKLTAEQMADFGIGNNLPYTLFYAGEFSEAEQAAQNLSSKPLALIIACEAALNGSQAGLAEARKRTAGEEQFKEVTSTAGAMLENLRKYALAADFKEAGASEANASDMQAEASLLRKTQPHEQLQLADDPASVALRFVLLEDDPDLTVEQLRSISSRNGAIGLAVSEVRDYYGKRQLRTIIEKARQGEIGDIGIDLSITRAQPIVQGNDASGYRVTLWSSANYRQSIYIVKEEGHYKTLGTFPFDEGLALEALDRLANGDLEGARKLMAWRREDLSSYPGKGSSQPPTPFWEKGSQADALKIKLSAAAILVDSATTSGKGIAILESAMNSASQSEKFDIAFPLSWGYYILHEDEKELAVLLEIVKQEPESKPAFIRRTACLRRLGRLAESDQIAQDWLRNNPDDENALRRLVLNAIAREDFPRARELDQELLDKGKGGALELNEIAWHSLFIGKPKESDVDAVLKATQLSNNSWYYLHTLGCIYTELGRLRDARDVLVQAIDSANYAEPDENFWYAFGRIAEEAGERETALSYYRRVTPPKDPFDVPNSCYHLAQSRLRAMQETAK